MNKQDYQIVENVTGAFEQAGYRVAVLFAQTKEYAGEVKINIQLLLDERQHMDCSVKNNKLFVDDNLSFDVELGEVGTEELVDNIINYFK